MKIQILEDIPIETRGELAFVLKKGSIFRAVPIGKRHITFFANGEKICLEATNPAIKKEEK